MRNGFTDEGVLHPWRIVEENSSAVQTIFCGGCFTLPRIVYSI